MVLKRTFDLAVLVASIPVLGPLFGFVLLLVRIKMGAPVFFKQTRPGMNGKLFEMWKFRTMTFERDTEGRLLPDAMRLTRFGRFLRSTSLDELPELFNVLRGEMSLVGPRPLLVQYLSRYNVTQGRRHEVRPGITGLAQINGRNALRWEDKFRLDVEYVDRRSLWLDVKILVLTVWKVLKRDGISAAGSATMPEFNPENEPPETLHDDKGVRGA